jgi:hypothetical protein
MVSRQYCSIEETINTRIKFAVLIHQKKGNKEYWAEMVRSITREWYEHVAACEICQMNISRGMKIEHRHY